MSIDTSRTRATIAASSLGIVGYLILLVASYLEHGRSLRGSTLMLLYLGYSTPADAMRARTLWSMPRDNAPIAAVFTACCVCKFVLLILEGWPKTVRPGVPRPTADERADIVARAFLWWLLPLFARARKKPALTVAVLPEIELELTRAANINDALRTPSIFRHLLAVRGWLLASAILPRLCYTGLLYTQPFLVQRATEFVSAPRDTNTYKIGGGLIAAYAIVYVGIAVRTSFHDRK